MTKSTVNGIAVVADGDKIIINGKAYFAPADIIELYVVDSGIYVNCENIIYKFTTNGFVEATLPVTGNNNYSSVGISEFYDQIYAGSANTRNNLTPFAKFLIIATVLGLLYWVLSGRGTYQKKLRKFS